MKKRKSKKIGQIIKGHLVLDSRRKNKDSEYLLECVSCGEKLWKSSGFLKETAACMNCAGGRNYRNAEGYTSERLYARYRNILRRVNDPNRYKGVTMCEEWRNDYMTFREWALANGYRDDLTIDRIDNTKGYEPSNCRWATPKEQANNRTSNRHIEYNGTKYTIAQLADVIGLPRSTVEQRVKAGWSIEDVAKTPYKRRKKWSELCD